MTDAEINLSIAKIEYPDAMSYEGTEDSTIRIYTDYPKSVVKNYVNNWANIGPIFEREKIPISYSHIYKVWKEGYGMHDFNGRIKDKSLTKTLALCYLKMKGVEI
jgi:hypothetical protein